MAALRMRAHGGASTSLERKRSPKSSVGGKGLNEHHGQDATGGLLDSPQPRQQDSKEQKELAAGGRPYARPKKLTKRQARRLEQEEARAL